MVKLELLHATCKHETSRGIVLLIHGACMGAWTWENNFLQWFAEQGYDCYAMSFRNHGGSPPKGGLRFKSLAEYVDDLHEVIQQLDGPLYLVGHSMGGFVIQHYLSGNPDTKVKKAVLLCSPPSHPNFSVLGRLIRQMPFAFLKATLQMSWRPVFADADNARTVMFSESVDASVIHSTTRQMKDESFLIFLQMIALKMPDTARVSTPIMIIGAEKDFLVSEKDTSKMAATYRVPAHIIPGAPHNLMLEEGWERTAVLIRDFFSQS